MAGGFSITISVLDQTTATLDKINANLERMKKAATAPFTQMSASFGNISKSLAKFSNVAGLSKITGVIGAIGGKFSKLIGIVGKLAGPLGAIFGGGLIAMAWKATEAWASYGHQVRLTSGYIGSSVTQVQRMQQASRIMGLAPNALAQTNLSLSDVFEQSVMNPGGLQSQLLKQAGINTAGKSRFQARNANNDDLIKLSSYVRGNVQSGKWNESSARQFLSQLGISPDMQQAMMQGGEYLSNAMDQAKKSGVQTEKQIDLEEQENEKLGVLKNNMEQLTLKIGSLTSEALNPLIDGFNDLMNPMKGFGDSLDALAAKIAAMATGVGGAKDKDGGGSWLDTLLDGLGLASLFGGGGILKSGAGMLGRGAMSLGGAALGALGIGGGLAVGGIAAGTVGALAVGSHYETEETRRAREANRKAQSVVSPSNMQTYDTGGGGPLPQGDDARYATVRDNLAKDLNISKEAASGIVSNLHAESGMRGINEKNPTVPGSRGGTGWAQWTGPRRVEFEKYAASMGLDPSSDQANYGYLVHELQASYPKVLQQLREGKITPQQAANVFFTGFESGGAPGLEPVRGKHVAQADRIAGLTTPQSGRAQVDINLNGFPKDTQTRSSTYGDLLGKPSVSTGMGSVLG